MAASIMAILSCDHTLPQRVCGGCCRQAIRHPAHVHVFLLLLLLDTHYYHWRCTFSHTQLHPVMLCMQLTGTNTANHTYCARLVANRLRRPTERRLARTSALPYPRRVSPFSPDFGLPSIPSIVCPQHVSLLIYSPSTAFPAIRTPALHSPPSFRLRHSF